MKSWNKLLAGVVAVLGMGWVLLGVPYAFPVDGQATSVDGLWAMMWAFLGLTLFVLSFFLYRRMNFARNLLVLLMSFSVFAIVARSIMDFIDTANSLSAAMFNLGFYVIVLALPVFVVLVITHKDVVGEFSSDKKG